MFEARIVSPHSSLYFAAEPTAYDVETIRQHLRAMMTPRKEVVVELRIDPADAQAMPLRAWLTELEQNGVRTRQLLPEHAGTPVKSVIHDPECTGHRPM